ncbi:hypothetical protein IQ06DRAFT_111490 [Phaeosphaeriaceae sp. SRC1lsM3a]|nr:hypothetical protein IQ06DRAFT_111490 [Stagonospora sp. SRC1lsM3a]
MTSSIVSLIKKQYHIYRHTTDVDAQGLFFSPTCMQTCRPNPPYCATSREQIVKYLADARAGNIHSSSSDSSKPTPKPSKQSRYTIRPLKVPAELEFGSHEVTTPIGYEPEELVKKANEEKWVGMCVDLWDEGAVEGLFIKVNYWWREEDIRAGEETVEDVGGKGWRQCFHDIIYLGGREGWKPEGGEALE